MNLALLPLLLVTLIYMSVTGVDVDSAEIMLRGDHSVTEHRGALIVGDANVAVPPGAAVPGPIFVIGGELRVRGTVEGDVTQFGGSVAVEPGATISGEFLHIAGEQAISEAAAVGRRTSIEEVVPAETHAVYRNIPWLIITLALALIGARRARKTPQVLGNVRSAITDHPLISLTVGALVSVTFLSLFVFMAFTLILIPVSLLGLLAGTVVVGYGVIAFGFLVGQRVDANRVGLATAEALALAAGARLSGASSLASLALGCGARRALVVPLVPAGRRDLYAGFFRAGSRGDVTLLAAPRVGPVPEVLAAVDEALAIAGVKAVRFVGPGAGRERALLERALPGSTAPAFRFEGLSALDLAAASFASLGPLAGLPGAREPLNPCYVRPAQAEERVRHVATAGDPVTLRPMEERDLARIALIEREVFSDPWPESFFRGELAQEGVRARVAEFGGVLAGYSVAWLGAGIGHLGNLAVVAGRRRRGIARRLVAELLEHASAEGVTRLTLEVRVSNFAAQALYRGHGFRLAGLRRRYYRDTGEDALVMEWRSPVTESARRAEARTPEARSTLP